MKPELVKSSRLLSLILRHKPEKFNIELDKFGWAKVSDIKRVLKVNQEQLEEIVETNDKKRFHFDEHKIRIRASQGHSVDVDVQLKEVVPPDTLYHGTVQKFLGQILKDGLTKQFRQHVHLSDNLETAIKVGERRGSPIILEINSKQMNQDGIIFLKSKNGVYLTNNVLLKYLTIKN